MAVMFTFLPLFSGRINTKVFRQDKYKVKDSLKMLIGKAFPFEWKCRHAARILVASDSLFFQK